MSPYKIRTGDGWVTAERVTEIIRRGMPQPALEAWKLKEAVQWALTHPQVAITVDTLLADWRSDQAKHANRGTRVHKAIAAVLRGEPLPEPDAVDVGYLEAWAEWRIDHPWEPVHVEQTLLSATQKVAGTADAIFEGSILTDWKTVEEDRGVYPDQLAQVAAYSLMRHLVTTQEIVGRAPIVTECRIVRLGKKGGYSETVVAGLDLVAARQLWHHVKKVAEGVGR